MNDFLLVNGNIYVLGNNKTLFKQKTNGFEYPNKKEIFEYQKIVNRNKENIFKDKKLNEIANINPELKKIDILNDVLDNLAIKLSKYPNFYEKLKTLKFDYTASKLTDDNYNLAIYNETDNYIIIDETGLSKIRNEKSGIELNNYIKHIFTHELLHMASSKDDINSDYLNSGFSISSKTLEIDLNVGINEAMTEILAAYLTDNNFIGYQFEIFLLMQITCFYDTNKMISDYFKAEGCDCFIKELCNTINNSDKAKQLLNNIENCYNNLDNNNRYLYICNAQSILLDYFEVHLNNLKQTQNTELLNYTYKIFKNYFMKKDNILRLKPKNPDLDLINSIDKRYEKLFESYTNEINNINKKLIKKR